MSSFVNAIYREISPQNPDCSEEINTISSDIPINKGEPLRTAYRRSGSFLSTTMIPYVPFSCCIVFLID